MNIVVSKRGMGKTKKLIEDCASMGGYIVCQSKPEADRIARVAKEMGLNIPLPLTYEEFEDKRYYGKGVSRFHIDNLELLLQYLTPVEIYQATMITEPHKLNQL